MNWQRFFEEGSGVNLSYYLYTLDESDELSESDESEEQSKVVILFSFIINKAN